MVTNRRLVTAGGPDFYPTPSWGTQALLNHIRFRGSIFEPCCGDGAMAEVIKAAGFSVEASDVVYRGYGKCIDFLDVTERKDNIVTNPPFNAAEKLLAHALKLARYKVCFLLRTAFLESRRRYEKFYATNPPSTLLVFSERLSMYPKGSEVDGGGTMSYAWFVWDKTDHSGVVKVLWIPPGLKPKSRHLRVHQSTTAEEG